MTLHYVTSSSRSLKVLADSYILSFPEDRPFVYLFDGTGRRLAELFFPSGVHTTHGRDDTTHLGAWELVDQDEHHLVLEGVASSSLWHSKVYRFRCTPSRFEYEVEVEGAGALDQVDYFGGYYSAQLRWGSGYFWSGNDFKRGFNPEPNGNEVNYFGRFEGSQVDLTGVPLPGKATWFFTPPPFFLAFEHRQGWLGVGVQPGRGENRFTEYSYRTQGNGFCLSLSYEGHTTVQGRMKLPALGFDFASSEWEALTAHISALKETNRLHEPVYRVHPTWWQEPIFCGWGSQCYVAGIDRGKAPSYARQALYDDFLATLDQNGVDPGIVVLDDKWQATYGDNAVDQAKWPDLPGFIRDQHERGRHVLLWLKAWDPEGVPVEECVTNALGLPVAVDPTHPAYEVRLRDAVRRMLSDDGYGADGFKIDFTARIPSGPNLCTYGDLWGLELLRRYLEILYDEAKQVKPDALVMAHTPHPYLGDRLDMIRLNDINTQHPVNPAMWTRYQVARLACPEAIIDTDNWPMKDKRAWRKYLRLQPEMGVPSLYFASHIDSTREPLTQDDYRLIREVWASHRANLQARASHIPGGVLPTFRRGLRHSRFWTPARAFRLGLARLWLGRRSRRAPA